MAQRQQEARPRAASADHAPVYLITGLPSFAARRMLRHLLDAEPEATVYATVPERLRERLDAQLPPEQRPERLRLLDGDTVKLDLGLSGDEYLSLTESVTDVFHMASFFFLGVDYDRAHEVNVRGTLNVLRAASDMPRLRRVNHFSTAYVAGDRTGVIMEDDLEADQRFRSPFERTKYEAELALRPWRARLPITIYRPSLIVGDSRTGAIDRNRMEGPYVLMKAMLGAPLDVPIPLPGKGDKPLNLVPVDWVCEAMATLGRLDAAVDQVFHLTDPNPLSARAVFDLVARHAGRRAPRGRVPYRLSRFVMGLPYIERLLRTHRQFLDDFNQLSLYNSINTVTLLEGHSRGCPSLPSYIERLVAFMLDEDELPPPD